MMSTMRRAKTLPAMAVLACGLALALGVPRSASAVDYIVNGASPSCSDTDPNAGSEAVPYCTIQAAANAHSGPGITIRVKPATYSERVNVPGNGAAGPGNEYTFLGDGSGVVVTGSPEVFFLTFNRSYVTIQGFTITATGSRGVYARSGSSNIIVRDNTITGATSYGIHFDNVSNSTIEANAVSNTASSAIGIAIYGGSDDNFIQDNDIYSNGKQGIHLSGPKGGNPVICTNTTANNTVQRNRTHHNGDSGIEFAGCATDSTSRLNFSYENGQHGFDHTGFDNTTPDNIVHVNDVAYHNGRTANGAGFNVDAASSSVTLYNCIMAENGQGPNSWYDLFVGPDASNGFAADYNLYYNSSRPIIEYVGTTYTTVVDFRAATVHEDHGTQGNPLFVDPANADFHLQKGSPAIDAATSSVTGFPLADAAGQFRMDDPDASNQGTGTFYYADRGALECLFATCGNPSFETNTSGWAGYVNGTGTATIARVSGGESGSWSLQITGPSNTNQFGANDSSNWVLMAPKAGQTYRFIAWVRSASYTGPAKLKVREYNNGVQIGGSTFSAEVTLSPEWQPLTVDRTIQAVDYTYTSTLDLQILYTPSGSSQVFQVDNVSITLLP